MELTTLLADILATLMIIFSHMDGARYGMEKETIITSRDNGKMEN